MNRKQRIVSRSIAASLEVQLKEMKRLVMLANYEDLRFHSVLLATQAQITKSLYAVRATLPFPSESEGEEQ